MQGAGSVSQGAGLILQGAVGLTGGVRPASADQAFRREWSSCQVATACGSMPTLLSYTYMHILYIDFALQDSSQVLSYWLSI